MKKSMKKMVFFSGGTALRGIAREMAKRQDLQMINLITVFDSGGSSAEIRKHFDILPIGDIRNRFISLIKDAHPVDTGLLTYRFGLKSQSALQKELNQLIALDHALIKKIKKDHQSFYVSALKEFLKNMPLSFHLQNASIGNLIFLGDYLKTKSMHQTIMHFKSLLHLKDDIFPITEESLHLGAHLEDGQTIEQQHRITAKETPALTSNIKDIFILKPQNASQCFQAKLTPFLKEKIRFADALIYPIGSFYTSVLSHFLLDGISSAIQESTQPKIYLPSTFPDPELNNRPLSFQVSTLLQYLKLKPEKATKGLTHILLDSKHHYPFELDTDKLPKGIQVLFKDILYPKNSKEYPKLSPQKTVQELHHLSLQ